MLLTVFCIAAGVTTVLFSAGIFMILFIDIVRNTKGYKNTHDFLLFVLFIWCTICSMTSGAIVLYLYFNKIAIS